ncbi:GNAT family N-acetyltransferase [Brevibacillus borstelensis]|jgi:predicted N-acetyltransferase YhbS|uniref:GNAT family N-acetyltransferase n=1 Tax=Brevibacillus borstelensis TaxID=45462 RepID=UPI000F0914BB|nr:GNAT family N-acetyltransferase [Brevibacillus borstelensis]MCC0563988.1 GNAT family N-acetyltransferase [Brevibacillus borstelensis]MED1873341.1 GNAT family N-acetyltransferase [Brevibacillus borstelensis]MED1881303.1 GNAT family N-acetyltransferase [Brevibacillus borstelensis]RNB66773.1 GNAT family N-acetyltransferase [Brevibacillus borstelensis]WNF05022.1 GNAT family N-acetyltransferase [Brevibacillus borstelensis]
MGGSSPIRVRVAAPGDREAIQKLLVEAYEEYEHLLPEGRWEEYREELRESAADDRPLARIVAEYDGEIVGAVQLYMSAKEAYGLPELQIDTPIIRYLSVLPKARGKGVATELIKESVRRSRKLGASALHLHTTDIMASAISLYERLGFERAPEKDIQSGPTLVKSYRLPIKEASIL